MIEITSDLLARIKRKNARARYRMARRIGEKLDRQKYPSTPYTPIEMEFNRLRLLPSRWPESRKKSIFRDTHMPGSEGACNATE